ncbi:TolC family protein [Catalinimonas sp. 4WD22]|uniref:TolC family protein n=1 Tax=Catalinimonas locisalis TaxID=3133978 RepID=UPI00310101BE
MMIKRLIFIFSVLSIFFSPKTALSQDTVNVLAFREYLQLVVANHPIVKQTGLLSESARQEIRIARSAFDPVLESKYYRKSFKGNNYFSIWENTLRIPLWYGIDILAGYENNGGPNINPEDLTTPQGLTSVGLSIPLGQGLIIDERRATLRQARLLEDLAEAERVKTINKFLLEAVKQYWDWTLAYELLRYNQEGLNFAEFRLSATREKASEGAAPAVDTVEAEILVQDFAVAYEKASLAFNNASLQLSTYLWTENLEPLEIPENVIPSTEGWEIESIQRDSLNQLQTLASENHPELEKIDLKIRQMEIQRRYYQDLFLPKIKLNINVLQTGFAAPEVYDPQFIDDNHKIGISLVQPLFLRKVRGQRNLYEAKIQEANYDLLYTNQEILAEVEAAFNDWQSLEEQIAFQAGKVRNYLILREAEVERYEQGIGTLFLINKRETSLVDSQIKLAELRAKYAKNKYYLQWTAGSLEMSLQE